MRSVWVWGWDDYDEHETHDSAREALEHWQEHEQDTDGVTMTEVERVPVPDWPRQARGRADVELARGIVKQLVEELDGECQGPSAEGVTERMVEAAMLLLRTVREEYVPWEVRPTGVKITYTREEALALIDDMENSDG